MAMRSPSGLAASLARLALTPAVSSSSKAAIASTSTLSRRVAPNSRPSARSYATTLQPPSQYSIGHLSPAQPAKKAKRLGRGDSSGRGGTSTRGHKGQKARTGNGKPTPGFEGGQTPIMRRFPKRGFVNSFAHETVPLNLSRLQTWIDSGRLDPSAPITVRELYLSRCIHRLGDGGVKLLGDGAQVLSQPLKLVVSRASTTAIKAVEKAGGSITCKYYTPLTLRALVKPEKWTDRGRLLPRESMPINRRDLLYYSDIRNRGYLAKMHVLGNGEGLTSPSSSAPPSADAVAEANDIVAEEEARVAQQAQAGEIKREDAAAAV